MGSHRSTSHTLRLFAALGLMLALLAPMLATARPAYAASPADCLGSQTRNVRYSATSNVLYVEGCGQSFTLSELLAFRDAAGKAPATGKLQLTDAANKTWLLTANVMVAEGATLKVVGGAAGDANWLRLKSESTGQVSLRSENGTLRFEDTKVTSWDTTTGAVDTTFLKSGSGNAPTRAFITVRSTWDGVRPTAAPTSCDVNEGTREPYEARMDVVNSELSYLGSYAAEAYGVTWKVAMKSGVAAPADRGLYAKVDVFGDVRNSKFHHNQFGVYTYGSYCQDFTGSEFSENTMYGLDPHDDSDYLTADNNVFRDNGQHGFICSVYCNNVVVTNNKSFRNQHGIMAHRRVDGVRIEGNESYDNRQAGIAIFDSHDAIVRNNISRNNAEAAIRLSVGSSGNLIENNTLEGLAASATGNGPVVYTYKGSDLPTLPGDGWPKNNIFRNNTITGFKTPVMKLQETTGNVFEANRIAGPAGGIHATSIGTSSTQQASNTFRDSEVGKALKLELNLNASHRLEDSRSKVWQTEAGLPTTVTPAGSSLAMPYSAVGATETFTTLDLSAKPANGSLAVKPTTWTTTAPFNKAWTESSTTTTGAVPHTVGDLQPGACYEAKAGTSSLGKFAADGNGRIAFTYGGGYGGSKPFTVASATGCATGGDTTAPVVKATPAGGSYTTAQSVALSANEPATIYYTTDGSAPTTGSAQYAAPINVASTTALKFFGMDAAGNRSTVQSETYTIAPPADTTAPVVSASPKGGSYTSAQSVTLSANESASIYYTTDGAAPTMGSTKYAGAIAIGASTTLKFFGVDAAGNAGAVVTETYTISTPPPATGALFQDGFESGDLSKWTSFVGLAVQGQTVDAGAQAARATSASGATKATYARKGFGSESAELYYRLRFNVVSQGANPVYLARVRTGGATPKNIFSVSLGSTGKLSSYNHTTLATTTGVVAPAKGVWHTLLVHVVVNGTASTTEVFLDGAKVPELSKTENLGTALAGGIEVGEGATTRIFDVAFDEVVADTAALPAQ